MVCYVYSFNPTEIINGTLAIFIHIYDKPHAYRDQYFSFVNLNFLYRPTRIYSEIYHGWWDLLSSACYVSTEVLFISCYISTQIIHSWLCWNLIQLKYSMKVIFLHLYEKLHADQDQYFFCFVHDVDHLCKLFSFSDWKWIVLSSRWWFYYASVDTTARLTSTQIMHSWLCLDLIQLK